MGVGDWLILGTLAVLSMWLGGAMFLRARHLGLHWTGTDGPFIGDQMQYLGWIRDAADNLRIGNPFRIEHGPELFVHPGLAISGLLTRLGLSAATSYLLWKPVAVLVLFFAVRAYVHRLVPGKRARLAALALALIGLSPMQDLYQLHLASGLSALTDRILGLEMWPILYLWGYPFTALAVALIPITLLLAERARHRASVPWAAAGGALVCSWLQPWQGATLLAVLIGTESLLWFRDRSRPRWQDGVPPVAGVAPLFYYQLLGHFDSGWHLAGLVNRGPGPVWWLLPLFLLPIVCVALFEYVRPAPTYQDVALRLWLVAGVLLYTVTAYTSLGTYPPHFFQGLGIPVAIMTVRVLTSVSPGWRRTVSSVLLVAILVVCVGVRDVREVGTDVRVAQEVLGAPYFIQPDEQRALEFLNDDRASGGVLSPLRLGQVVPGLTGRHTYVGISSWTPDFPQRTAMAKQLFSGSMSSEEARQFVQQTGARFLLADCGTRADLGHTLGTMISSVHRFGCATVYQLR
jgi:hypothetical protein